jgi:hypothetical protein
MDRKIRAGAVFSIFFKTPCHPQPCFVKGDAEGQGRNVLILLTRKHFQKPMPYIKPPAEPDS